MWNYCVIASCQLLVCGTIVLLLNVNCWYVKLLCYCCMSTVGMWNYCVIARHLYLRNRLLDQGY
jgi:uncharacterized membrane protein